MAFDGITVAAVTQELKNVLTGGRITKIAQPEADELLLTIKTPAGASRLYISASASLPLIYLTDENKPSPMTAPNFCMLLRKHIGNGRITGVSQPGLERIIHLDIEHLDELGDLCKKKLIVEIMGKHSNIIFCDADDQIIDSIKHVSGMVSSVREVLPGRHYFIPQTQEKENPLTTESPLFYKRIPGKAVPIFKALYMNFTGLSPMIAQEICHRACIDADKPAQSLDTVELEKLWNAFASVTQQVKSQQFTPVILYENGSPREYACIPLTNYAPKQQKNCVQCCFP